MPQDAGADPAALANSVRKPARRRNEGEQIAGHRRN